MLKEMEEFKEHAVTFLLAENYCFFRPGIAEDTDQEHMEFHSSRGSQIQEKWSFEVEAYEY